jgi:hypothetical protein
MRRDQSLALQDVADRRGRRPTNIRRLSLQKSLDLLWTKMRKTTPRRDNARGKSSVRRMRAALRRMASPLKPFLSAALPTTLPDVKSLPADPIAPAKIRNRENARLVVPQQRDTLFHRTGLLERHRQILLKNQTNLHLSGINPV